MQSIQSNDNLIYLFKTRFITNGKTIAEIKPINSRLAINAG